MRLFGEIGGATLEGAGSLNLSGRGCQDTSKNILRAWKLLLCGGLRVCSKYFCTLRYIVRQRAYVICDAII